MPSYLYRYFFYAVLLATPFVFYYNNPLFYFFNCTRNTHALDAWFLLLTSLADGLWVVMIASFAQSLQPRNFGVFLLALVIGNVFLQSLKYFFDAPRPTMVFGENAMCFLGQKLTARSFPSGHAFSAILLFLYMRPRKSLVAAVLVLALAILAVLSRVYVGAHFPRDVIAGGVIAVLSYKLAEALAPRLRLWQLSENVRSFALFVLGLGSTLVYIFAYHEKTRALEYILTPAAYVLAVYWCLNFLLTLRRKRMIERWLRTPVEPAQ